MRFPSGPLTLHRPGRSRIPGRALAAGLIALAVAGCGEVSNTFTPAPGSQNVVRVMLAGAPSAFDVGLYEAQALGYFKATDIDLQIEVPRQGEDPVQELHDGNVLVAFASLPTVLLHRNRDEPVVGIAAIVDAPIPSIKVPVPAATGTGTATTGAQTSTAPAPTGGATATPATTTTAASTTAATAAGTATSPVAAIAPGTTMTAKASPTPTTTTPTTTSAPEPDSGLWSAKLQTLIKRSSTPAYDGLNVVVRKGTIVDHAPLLRRFVQALARGYRAARANPAGAVQTLIAQVPSLASSQALQLATVKAAMSSFFPTTGQIWGWQAPVLWNRFGTWMTTNKLISNPNALTDASTNELLQGEGV